MRLVYKKFDDGTYKLYETDDAGQNYHLIDGNVPPDHKSRCSVFIEVSCADARIADALIGLDIIRAKLG
jgi:hypothetical protein